MADTTTQKTNHYAIEMYNEAISLRRGEDYPRAETLFIQVLAVREKTLGSSDEASQICLEQLAYVYLMQDKYEEAIGLYKQLLYVRQGTNGREHRSTWSCLSNIAGIYMSQKKYRDAENVYRELLPLVQQGLGAGSPPALGCLRGLLEALYEQGKVDEGRVLARQGMKITSTMDKGEEQVKEEEAMRELCAKFGA